MKMLKITVFSTKFKKLKGFKIRFLKNKKPKGISRKVAVSYKNGCIAIGTFYRINARKLYK